MNYYILTLCHSVFTERFIFRLSFRVKQATRAHLGYTIHETQRKKWRPYAGTSSYQNYANSAFLLLYSSIPILPFLIYPTTLCKFFTLAKKYVGVRIIVIFLFVFIPFLIFVCSKGHSSSDSGSSKENFIKRVQR